MRHVAAFTTQVMRSRWTLPFTRATGAVLLHNLMRSFPTSMCEEVCLQHGGIRVFTDIIQHYIIPLTSKAHAAGACAAPSWQGANYSARPRHSMPRHANRITQACCAPESKRHLAGRPTF